ncbi:MAG: 2TM domain-containing protein [Flavobacterium sp.]
MENEFEVHEKLKRIQKHAEAVQGVYVHAMCYVGVNLATLTYWYFDDFIAPVFWPRCFTILTGGCGIVLLGHAAVVFGSGWLMKRNWEEEKIKQLIEKNKTKQQNQ